MAIAGGGEGSPAGCFGQRFAGHGDDRDGGPRCCRPSLDHHVRACGIAADRPSRLGHQHFHDRSPAGGHHAHDGERHQLGGHGSERVFRQPFHRSDAERIGSCLQIDHQHRQRNAHQRRSTVYRLVLEIFRIRFIQPALLSPG